MLLEYSSKTERTRFRRKYCYVDLNWENNAKLKKLQDEWAGVLKEIKIVESCKIIYPYK